MASVEIIAIGNELLLGMVLDTNTHWLCRQITGRGGRVRRATLVPDELNSISLAVKAALSEGPDLIFTTGGLGPTQDDMTLQAVAEAINKKLEPNKNAYEMIVRRYKGLFEAGRVDSSEMSESRKKMALLPAGAVPLENKVGTAPGVLLEHEKSKIICLPGVPAELKDIFQNSLQPLLEEIFGETFYLEKELALDLVDESVLAPVLKEINQKWPAVYIKSRPQGFDEESKILITCSMSGPKEAVEQTINDALQELKRRLKRYSSSTTVTPSPPSFSGGE